MKKEGPQSEEEEEEEERRRRRRRSGEQQQARLWERACHNANIQSTGRAARGGRGGQLGSAWRAQDQRRRAAGERQETGYMICLQEKHFLLTRPNQPSPGKLCARARSAQTADKPTNKPTSLVLAVDKTCELFKLRFWC
ncbi:unnamed protein product [Pleuronectes platessa]|uniref:Uncharacterized protein n=1 Tax=Pleuronectes platessa TaxID=8262 RepID=A0A9N7Y4L0_PLEPL|nr:unnamed protein product [Pleuronectes platessa]